MPTKTLLTHCRRDRSTGDVVRVPEDLQAAWLQGTQHGDALVLSSVSGVVRSLGKRTQGLLRRSWEPVAQVELQVTTAACRQRLASNC